MNKNKIFKKPYLIAEIGINHNGSLKIAREMISVAKNSGFNAVKFQKISGYLCSRKSEKYNEGNPLEI